MRRRPEPCNWRLIVGEAGCTANDEDVLLPIQTSLLTIIKMAVIGPGQGLPLMNLSCVIRIVTISAEIRARLAKTWEMML